MSQTESYKQPLIDLEKRDTVSRKEYDYQINARAQTLRVLARALLCIEENHQHHTMFDEYDGYKESALEQDNLLTIKILKTAIGC
jgi:mRNA-degrading endonuclease YafQ of YafQ-DinJ toxin-antitoxin module